MNKRAGMAQLRRAVQLWLNTLEDETLLQEVAGVAPCYQVGYAYKTGQILAWGQNALGDPQLWRVLQPHTAQADWPPHEAASLYKAIGLTEAGIPVWAQPTGAHDCYNMGDRCSHLGTVWESLIDGNTTEPGSDARWWQKKS